MMNRLELEIGKLATVQSRSRSRPYTPDTEPGQNPSHQASAPEQISWGSVLLSLNTKKLSTLCEVLLLGTICAEAEVANPHETIGKDVEQEATDELIGLKRHRPKSVGVSLISNTSSSWLSPFLI